MRKLTQDFVNAQFASEGYTVLSQYLGGHKKIKVLCPNSHVHEMTWSHFSSGKRCPHCIGRVVSQNEIKKLFEANGYTLLSDYINAKTKVDFLCPNGHKHSILAKRFRDGSRCAYCTKHAISKEDVRKCFEKEGYKLLSDYKDSKTKVKFICPKGHQHSILYLAFKHGGRCSWCAGHVVNEEEVRSFFEQNNYKLLSKYVNGGTKMKCVCPFGHAWETRWQNFLRGHRCSVCSPGGYNPRIPGRLYYVRFYHNGKYYYKIGITNKTIKDRFKKESTPYVVLMDLYYDDGRIPFKKEASILRKHKKYIYKGRSILLNGNSELFTKDVLELDSNQLSLCELLV